MNPFIWVFIILMTLDALRELAGASSIFLACSVKWLGARWAYLRTISMDSHPPISWSTDNGTPDWISQLAQVCLRSWKRKSSIPARRQADSHDVLLSMRIFLTAGVDVPSARLAALVCTNTHLWCLPIWSRNTLQAVSFSATPMARFDCAQKTPS